MNGFNDNYFNDNHFTAIFAAKCTETHQHSKIRDKKYNKIIRKIKSAAYKGLSNILIYHNLSDENIEKLKDKGFRIDIKNSRFNFKVCLISW